MPEDKKAKSTEEAKKTKKAKKIEIELLGDTYQVTETDLMCVWDTDGPCDEDKVYMIDMFEDQIALPVCRNHAIDHLCVMKLHANDYDVDKITGETPEWRREEVLTIQLAGLDDGKKQTSL